MEKLRNFLFFTTFIYIFLFENFMQVCDVSWSYPPTTSLKPPDPLNTSASQPDVLFLFYNPLSPASAVPMLMNVRSSIERGQPANVHSLAKECGSPSLSIWLSVALHLGLGRRETLPTLWWVFSVILLTCSFEFMWAATMPCSEANIHSTLPPLHPPHPAVHTFSQTPPPQFSMRFPFKFAHKWCYKWG